MQVLCVNIGSSSLRLSLNKVQNGKTSVVTSYHNEHGHDEDPRVLIDRIMQQAHIDHVDALVHRIVHGGPRFRSAIVVDQDVLHELDRVSSLAPLHNPPAVQWLRKALIALPSVPHVVVFDTEFFTNMPKVATHYALPRKLCEKHSLQRYGFHGLAHEFMWSTYATTHPAKANNGRIVSLQLGSGCSIAAVCGGIPLDTSMGFSPLEGLVMGTRCGDVDAGLVLYLQQQLCMTASEVSNILEHKSGLLGISDYSNDMQKLTESDDEAASFAIHLFCYRIRKYINAYIGVLQGCDAIVFGGGIGKHSSIIRRCIVQGLEWLGVKLSDEHNVAHCSPISMATSSIEILVMDVDETHVMTKRALLVLTAK